MNSGVPFALQPILLVEDDENDFFFFTRAMAKIGLNYPLNRVADGRQAIDYLTGLGQYADRSRFPVPGLVLLDLKLPFLSGMEVLEWIRGQPAFRTLVVVMLTSSHLEIDVSRAYHLGVNSFLVKPSSVGELEKTVRLIFEYWLNLNVSELEANPGGYGGSPSRHSWLQNSPPGTPSQERAELRACQRQRRSALPPPQGPFSNLTAQDRKRTTALKN